MSEVDAHDVRHERPEQADHQVPELQETHFCLQDERAIYSDVLSSGRRIRLLQLADPNDGIEQVTCRLETVWLGDWSMFDALSYAWGSTENLATMKANGEALAVTRNLYDALSSFRATRALTGFIWIDAICINQDSDAERSHQVTLTKEIFTRATIVHIWLGPAVEGSKQLFHAIA